METAGTANSICLLSRCRFVQDKDIEQKLISFRRCQDEVSASITMGLWFGSKENKFSIRGKNNS